MKLRFTATALRQIAATLSHVAAQSVAGAESISKRLLAAGALIQEYPGAGQATTRENIRRLVLVPYPYVIFYRVSDDEIIILRFRHTSRKP